MKTAANCPLCSREVKTTHRMQTLRAQMVYHLRGEHNMTILDAKRVSNKLSLSS